MDLTPGGTSRLIPGARLVVVRGAGHSSSVEQPAQVTAALEAFPAESPNRT